MYYAIVDTWPDGVFKFSLLKQKYQIQHLLKRTRLLVLTSSHLFESWQLTTNVA